LWYKGAHRFALAPTAALSILTFAVVTGFVYSDKIEIGCFEGGCVRGFFVLFVFAGRFLNGRGFWAERKVPD